MVHPTFRHDKWIQKVAYVLTKNRQWLREDMEQELRLFMVEHPDEPDGILKTGARCWGIDFLHCRRANYSYKNAFVHFSLTTVETQGIQVDSNRDIHYPNSIPSDTVVAGRFAEFHIPRSCYTSCTWEERIFEELRIEELRSLCTKREWELLYDRFYLGLTYQQIGAKHSRSRS